MQIKKLCLLMILLVIILAGCSPSESTPQYATSYPLPERATGYPLRNENVEEAGETSYPVSEGDPDDQAGPVFTIAEPVAGGDTVITGTGPAGVPIILVDVSEVGLPLGETVINEDDTYIFNLETPLQSGHSIGIMLGDLTGTDLDENDFIYSDTYFVRPLIGILFDMVFVE